MSVFSPTPSAHSLLSPKTTGYNSAAPSQRTPSIPSGVSRTHAQTLAFNSAKLPDEGLNLSPDELFTKYTVSEVRAVQQRLRADADAKQEELRLMVGERYRDLLQASSSIISIAKSSQHVLSALVESREAITSQYVLPSPPKTASMDGLDDQHLGTLQVLSAHMKLLLDAPEHLWRLIERKHYLQAAWLFLLSRVVHRALLSRDDNDEQSWTNEGIDVPAEFPLVQRQWDVVSQFRPQIIHKSTLSLREAGVPSEETCSTLVTLHLLDSRPLTETLATLLLQRSKTLKTIISSPSGRGNSKASQNTAPSNGHSTIVSELLSLRAITQVMKTAFNTIAQTMVTARAIFQDGIANPSLIICVLRSMQEDKSDIPSSAYRLPAELHVTTQSLLTHLTSSANFQLLPANLQSYKPYVDIDSSSTHLPPDELSRRLQEWFQTSCEHWQNSAAQWLGALHSLKDVWTLRSLLRRCIVNSGLTSDEISFISSRVDALYHSRIIGIWQSMLSDTETRFKKSLRDKLSYFAHSTITKDIYPVDFLFLSPSIPILSPTIKSSVDTPFQKYQLSLKRQLIGRTAQLDAVISTVEQCARAIQQDFLHTKTNADESSRPLNDQLMVSYQPVANALTMKVINILREASEETMKHSDSGGLVFLSCITDALMSSSPFVDNINCTQHVIQDFRLQVSEINQSVLRRWGNIVICSIIQECKAKAHNSSKTAGLSPALLHGLLSLCDRIRQLGVIYHPVKQDAVVQESLRSFITLWIKEFWEQNIGMNALFDILFLISISEHHGEPWNGITDTLSGKLKVVLSDDSVVAEARRSVSEYLAKTQTLFAILLPPPAAPILDNPLSRFGTPAAGQAQQPAIELAKPSPRFGMLLVGNVGTDR